MATVVAVVVVGISQAGAGAVPRGAARTATGTAASTVSLQVQQSPMVVGAKAAVTVSVASLDGTGTTPTGTVRVSVDGQATGAPVPLLGGAAVWYDTGLAVGAHAVTAAYTGDMGYAASTAVAQNLVVLPAGTSAYTALTPARILNTIPGAGQTGYRGGQPKGGSTVRMKVFGRGGVPGTGVSAVAMNVTVTNTRRGGYVTAWPDGQVRPPTSTVTTTGAGQSVADLAVVPVGADGVVDLYLSADADLLVDVQGYFSGAVTAAAGRLVPLTPARILNTVPGAGQTGYRGDKPKAGATVRMKVSGRGGVPVTGVSAVALTVTATAATAPGFVTVWPSGKRRPPVSNLNLIRAGQTRPNAVWVPVGADGYVDLYLSRGAHLLVDVDGYFTDSSAADGTAGLFVAAGPARLLNTTPGASQTGYSGAKPAAGQTVKVQVAGEGLVPGAGVAAVVGNTTAAAAAKAGYVTVWQAGKPRPATPNVYLAGPGDTAGTLTVSGLGAGGALDLFTRSSANLLFDMAGYFTAEPVQAPPVTERLSDTPAATTRVLQPSQVGAVTPDATGTELVLAAGVRAPAVGAGVVLKADATHPDGATGRVVSATPGRNGTTTLQLAPASLDELFSSFDLDYNGPAVLEPAPGVAGGRTPQAQAQEQAPRASRGGGGGSFDFTKAFTCTSAGSAIETASLAFENTTVEYELHIGPGLTPSVVFVFHTEPVVTLSATAKANVSCSLTSSFRKANTLRWRILVEGIPVTVTLQPTFSFKATAHGKLALTEHFSRSVGFASHPDGSIGLINSGSQHTERVVADATLKASLSMGADISAKVLDIVGLTVGVGPEVDADADAASGCITVTAQVNASLTVRLNLWIKKWQKTVASGKLGPWTLYTNCEVKVTTTSLPPAHIGEAYDEVLQGSGGTEPLEWSITAGSLPTGLSMSDAGEITGTPTDAGYADSTFTVTATDQRGVSGEAPLTLTVLNDAPCIWGPTSTVTHGLTCVSTDPTITVYMSNSGDTSACEFSVDFVWGDGQQQNVTEYGGVDGGSELLTSHTYASPGTYTIPISGQAVIGSCSFTGATLTFTLQPKDGTPTPTAAGRTTGGHFPGAKAPRPGRPGVTIG